MRTRQFTSSLICFLCLASCSRDRPTEAVEPLVGAWRGGVRFATGAFAATKDLEFLYVFNVGGTMTESSNYDGAPPVPPAYGVWRRAGERTYEARYEYYWTRPPSDLSELTKGNGWAPGGHGVLSQEITLSTDGNSFESTLRLQVFDSAGKPAEKESTATATAARIQF